MANVYAGGWVMKRETFVGLTQGYNPTDERYRRECEKTVHRIQMQLHTLTEVGLQALLRIGNTEGA